MTSARSKISNSKIFSCDVPHYLRSNFQNFLQPVLIIRCFLITMEQVITRTFPVCFNSLSLHLSSYKTWIGKNWRLNSTLNWSDILIVHRPISTSATFHLHHNMKVHNTTQRCWSWLYRPLLSRAWNNFPIAKERSLPYVHHKPLWTLVDYEPRS